MRMLEMTAEMALQIPSIKDGPNDAVLFFDTNPYLIGIWSLKQEGITLPGESADGKPALHWDSLLPTVREALAIIAASDRITSGVFCKVGPDQWQFKKHSSPWIPEFPVSLAILLATDL